MLIFLVKSCNPKYDDNVVHTEMTERKKPCARPCAPFFDHRPSSLHCPVSTLLSRTYYSIVYMQTDICNTNLKNQVFWKLTNIAAKKKKRRFFRLLGMLDHVVLVALIPLNSDNQPRVTKSFIILILVCFSIKTNTDSVISIFLVRFTRRPSRCQPIPTAR